MKPRPFLLSLAIAVCGVATTKGQAPQLANIVKPSPNVQAMQKYGDIPISAYTGIPNISIPIYTVKFRDITVPISLSYHASGIKVSEEASQVGLGWTLNAAGTVSRNIIGGDDFLKNYFNTSVPEFADGELPKDRVQSNTSISSACVVNMISKVHTPTLYTADMSTYLLNPDSYELQPDQYYFNFPGESGKFVLKHDKSAVLQSQKKLLIAYNSSSETFAITGLDGTKYDFTLKETYNDGETHKSAWYLTQITSPTGNTVSFYYTPFSNYVKPSGGYSESNEDVGMSLETMGGGFKPTGNAGYHGGTIPGKQYYQYRLDSIGFLTGQVRFNYSFDREDVINDAKLDSIQIFSKNKAGLTSALPVKTVVLSYDYFVGSGSSGFSSDGNVNKRLKLTQVQQVGYYTGKKEMENPYKFTYCESGAFSSGLPLKTSFGRDHWGYWNGKNNSSLLPSLLTNYLSGVVNGMVHPLSAYGPERDVDTAYLRAFSLISIQYPTGGSTEFQYEANDFDENASNVNDNFGFPETTGLQQRTKQLTFDTTHTPKYLDGDMVDMGDEFWDPINMSNTPEVTISVAFTFNSGNCNDWPLNWNEGDLKIQLYDSNHNIITSDGLIDMADKGTSYCTSSDVNETFDCPICNGGPVLITTKKVKLYPGKYYFKAYTKNVTLAGGGSGPSAREVKVTFTWYAKATVNKDGTGSGATISYAGGLRIKRIIDHDDISSTNDKVKRYVYHYTADKNSDGTPEEYSYGIRMTKPRYCYFDVSSDVIATQVFFGCATTAYWSVHMSRSSDSQYPLNGSAAGSIVGYSRVTELFGEHGENGKKMYEYINEPDIIYAFQEGFTNLGFPVRPPSNSTLPNSFNGQLLHEVDYANNNSSFVKIKETSNQYTTEDLKENVIYGLENRQTPGGKFGATTCGTAIVVGPCTNNYILTYPILKSQWNYLSFTDDKVYNQGDTTQFTETMANYSYDPLSLLPATTTVNNSKGELITTITTYPLDYKIGSSGLDAFAQGVKNLQTKNVVAAPVEKYIKKSNADGTNARTVGAVLTAYNATDPTPSFMYSAMLASPSTTFSPLPFTPTTLTTLSADASYASLISFDSYDANGNILQQHKINDINHSYVWDYKSSMPVAEVINAPQTQIAYTSFEFDGTGNWTVPSTSRYTDRAITGNQSYNLSSGNISKSTGIATGDTVIVSYWSLNGSYNVTGSINTLTGKTAAINGRNWTYYEHTVTGVTTVTVSPVSGTQNGIDELRLYPLHAQMATYTFEPLIGMTSQCDVNNRASYYQYDGLGRLKDIKDQDGNILKTFEYHYKQ